MYILERYSSVLGIDKSYCKKEIKNDYHTLISIENIEDLILYIKYYLKSNYPDCLLIEESVFWNKEKETVYFEYVDKFENNFEDIQPYEFTIQEIKDINTVLDITKL